MLCSARARIAYSHGPICSPAFRIHLPKRNALAKIFSNRFYNSQSDNGAWQESPAKRTEAAQPKWIAKQVVSPTEVQRIQFRHPSGKEYEIGVWASGDARNLQPTLLACEELKAKLLPNLQEALRLQHLPVGVPSIRAAMIMAGRLPLCTTLSQSLCESFAFHACVSSQPKEEAEEVYQLFKQQVKRKVDQIQEAIQKEEQEDKAYFEHHGHTKNQGWSATQMLHQQNKGLVKVTGMISLKETDELIPSPSAFVLPNYVKNAVKLHQTNFKHYNGNLFEVGMWAYPQNDALQTIRELLHENSLFKNAFDEIKKNLAKDLSAALDLQYGPYCFSVSHAASQVAGYAPLSEKAVRLPTGEVNLISFVCRQPAYMVEEVKRAFDRQIREAAKSTGRETSRFDHIRPELFIRFEPPSLIGSPPDNPLLNMIFWPDRIAKTEQMLEWADEGFLSSKNRLKWLEGWEAREKP